jgi:NADH dehydrogenase/NADH:ubiquinone oxidoreductase subunit G
MPVRAWWFLRIAKNATIPPDVGRYLGALRDSNKLAVEEIERKRQAIIDQGAADGKTISTEAALKHVLERKAAYDGPNREEYVADLDRFIEDMGLKYRLPRLTRF